MDYRNYTPIQIMKKSEWAEVLFAAVEGLERPVVVKRLKKANQEIYREVEKLQSAHVPKVYHVEEQEDELLVVEEYIDGRTLGVYLKEEQPSDLQKIELMLQLCDGLEELHSCVPPVIHRDIKPSNILITNEGILKIIDFDAARQYNPEKSTSDTRLLGTIEYAAPEQFGYAQTDARSDIYSMGVVFSELKIGKETLFAKEWKQIVDKCTSFDPENRYQKVAGIKKDLGKCVRKIKKGLLLWTAEEMITRVRETVADLRLQPNKIIRQRLATEMPEDAELFAEQERVIGRESGEAYYTFQQLSFTRAHDVSHRLNDNNAISMRFEKLYGELIYKFNEPIDLTYCVDITLKMRSATGKIAILFFDENFNEVGALYQRKKTIGTQTLSFSIGCDKTATYIGFRAEDDELFDYSEFTAVIYSMKFQFVCTKNAVPVTYRMEELKQTDDFWTDYHYDGMGGLCMKFNRLYGTVRLKLPEPLDMDKCSGIVLMMQNEKAYLSVKLLGKTQEDADVFYNIMTTGMQQKGLTPETNALVSEIAFTTCDTDFTDYENCETTIYSVTFYMREE